MLSLHYKCISHFQLPDFSSQPSVLRYACFCSPFSLQCALSQKVLPNNYQVIPFIYQKTTDPWREWAFPLSLWYLSTAQPSSLSSDSLLSSRPFSRGCSQPPNHTKFTFFCPLPLLLIQSNLHTSAVLQEGSHAQLFTHCTPKQSSPQAPILSLYWSTTPAGPMILHQTIVKYTFDWGSSPGYPDYSVQAALSLLTMMSSMIWPANCISTDPVLVSRGLMERFNGIWPYLDP